MPKQLKRTLVLSSLVTLLPMPVGLLLWNRLPERLATHFDLNSLPNGWSSKPFAVFGLPLILLGCHLLCVFATAKDPRAKNAAPRLLHLTLWVCPVVSLFVGGSIYLTALGRAVPVALLGQLLVGALFLCIGNYLPKCRQNSTLGIKLPWTLADETNWNRTHRLAGWLWTGAGLLLLLCTPLGRTPAWLLAALIAITALLPAGYSFAFSRRKG